MDTNFLNSLKQKIIDAKCHTEILKSRKEIMTQMQPIKNFSNKILSQIIADFHDMVPITEKCVELNQLKEETKDPCDERLYQLVKNNLTIKDHPLIKRFIKENKVSLNEAIFYLQSAEYNYELAKLGLE